MAPKHFVKKSYCESVQVKAKMERDMSGIEASSSADFQQGSSGPRTQKIGQLPDRINHNVMTFLRHEKNTSKYKAVVSYLSFNSNPGRGEEVQGLKVDRHS